MDYSDALITASTAFGECIVIPDHEGKKSNWKTGGNWRDATGPNSLFRIAAYHFQYAKNGPWFFCEPDCIPIKKDAFDLVWNEYLAVAKPFMGTIVEMPGWNERIPRRMNGVAIYAENAVMHAPSLLRPTEFEPGKELAFDIAGANEVVLKAHDSKLFQHIAEMNGELPTFPKHQFLIKPEVAFFHRCKDGSLIRMLAAGGNGASGIETAPGVRENTGSQRITLSEFKKRLRESEMELEPRKRPRTRRRRKRRTIVRTSEQREKMLENLAKARAIRAQKSVDTKAV